VFFVLHHKGNFVEQIPLSLFKRLGRYWSQIQEFTTELGEVNGLFVNVSE
jgi:hypothetical protein